MSNTGTHTNSCGCQNRETNITAHSKKKMLTILFLNPLLTVIFIYLPISCFSRTANTPSALLGGTAQTIQKMFVIYHTPQALVRYQKCLTLNYVFFGPRILKMKAQGTTVTLIPSTKCLKTYICYIKINISLPSPSCLWLSLFAWRLRACTFRPSCCSAYAEKNMQG